MTALSRRELNRRVMATRILDAALAVFARNGFAGTTMEQVAQEAGITKPTLYQYHPSKAALFEAVLTARRDIMLTALERPNAERMVEQLHRFAWSYARAVLRPELLSLARLMIAEAQRMPEIGRIYQSFGPDRLLAGMIEALESYRDAGRLTFDEPEPAAQDLWGLILSAPRNKALHEPDWRPGDEDLARHIDHGLRGFLRLYAADAARELSTLAKLCGDGPPPA